MTQGLDWDTAFLGVRVSRITDSTLDAGQLAATIADLRDSGVGLVYWSAQGEARAEVVERLGGQLVDRKLTWVADLREPLPAVSSATAVQPFATWMSASVLEALAVQSAAHSRFTVDPKMPRDVTERLYRTWMRRSLSGDLARVVLVACEGRCEVGMVTVTEGDAGASIGLLAVDATARGRGHGGALVSAAQHWARERGNARIRVVTQTANVEACRLYQRSGFTIDAVEFVYHFWL
jgi:dTDP-4-amino-4,6-dideoxy-D-galactose acyltransferase